VVPKGTQNDDQHVCVKNGVDFPIGAQNVLREKCVESCPWGVLLLKSYCKKIHAKIHANFHAHILAAILGPCWVLISGTLLNNPRRFSRTPFGCPLGYHWGLHFGYFFDKPTAFFTHAFWMSFRVSFGTSFRTPFPKNQDVFHAHVFDVIVGTFGGFISDVFF
jgi:hypothetical protein